MVYKFLPQGVCSKEMYVELDEENTIQNLTVIGGCNGNLQGISSLVQGMPAEEVISRLKGIQCGPKFTSCPDQLACGLERILAEQNKNAAHKAAD